MGNREGRQWAATREPGALRAQAGRRRRAGQADEDHPRVSRSCRRMRSPLRVNEVRGASNMRNYLSNILNDGAGHLLRRVVGLYVLLIGANLAVWAWALAVLREHPGLLGTAALAYTCGLRHAVA